MKNKRIIVLCITAVVLIITGILYFSYGYYLTNIAGIESSKKLTSLTKIFKFEFSDGSEKLISNNTNFIPGSVLEKTFIIKNKSTEGVYFNIDLDEVTNTFSRTSDIVYEIYYNDEIISTSTFPITNGSIATNLYIEKDGTRTYTLKVKYLNSDENQISDVGKSISASIVFSRTDSPKTKFNILGNSYQDIGSEKNLLVYPYAESTKTSNGVSFTDNGYGTIIANGTAIGNAYFYFLTQDNYLTLEAGDYTLTGLTSGSTVTYYMQIFNLTTGKYIVTQCTSAATFTLTETSNLKLILFIVKGVTVNNLKIKPQIEKGSTGTSYEKYGVSPAPDNPSEIVSLGNEVDGKYIINMKSVGKNLFDEDDFVNTFAKYYNSPTTAYVAKETFDGRNVIKMHGGMNIYGRNLKYMKNKFKENVSYTISFEYYDVLGSNGYFGPSLYFVYTDGTIDRFFASNDRLNTSEQWLSLSFTSRPNKTIDYIQTSYYTGIAYTYLYNIQIEEGNSKTDYEPYDEDNYDVYLNEPLRCVGNVCDYIDLINKKVIRQINVVEIGNSWQQYVDSKGKTYPCMFIGIAAGRKEGTKILFTHDIQTDNSTIHGDQLHIWAHTLAKFSNYLYWGIPYDVLGVNASATEEELIAAMNTYQKTQKENGTPIIIHYILNTPKEENVSLPDVGNYNNRTLYVSDGSLYSSKIEIE